MKKAQFFGLSEEGFHRIAYTEWGTSSNTMAPVVCVHGLTRNGRDFDRIAQYLNERNYPVFCPDMAGRGDSDWLNNPLNYTYEQYIADTTIMIAKTNASELNFIGTSMGGLIGMFLASQPKSPIRRLVLNDIGPQISLKGIARIATYAGKDPDFYSLEEAKQHFKIAFADSGPLTDQELQEITESSIRETTKGKFVSKLDQAIKVVPIKSKIAWKSVIHPLKTLEGVLFDIELWSVWKNITCPVLVIHGKKSDILLSSTVTKMQQTHANVEVIEVPDVGHAPTLFDAKTQEMIYQWLKK